MSDELAFNSKTDLGILILLLTAVTACLWGVASIWDANSIVLWPVAAVLGVGILVPLWMIVSLKYFLSDDRLRVRCGPFQWRIPIRDITAVTATNSAQSSPAMSLDRLLIEHGENGRVMISPEPRAEFLRQLEHRRKQAG
jgi:hypothetical protein